ncbi:glycosyltransferase family 21 protein [Zopfochytrium polystomum]|nr:glycosyltransferase family 21 protein [Zopfochytrium polystomum]
MGGAGAGFVGVVGIVMSLVMYSVSITSIVINRKRLQNKPEPKSSKLSPQEAPGVTVLRPLKGTDGHLKENLEASFKQEYPLFELVFSVASEHDPSVAVVRELMQKYPRVDARLILGDRNIGVNPKINNLIRGYESAKYDLIWVLDSNIWTDTKCMARSVDIMCQPNVGLVHHVPVGVDPLGPGSLLERAFLNTAHAKMYTCINAANIDSCVVGKSNIYRKSTLDRAGGLAPFGKFISEDNIIGQAIWRMKFRHVISPDLAYHRLGYGTWGDYFMRRFRWCRIRKVAVFVSTIVEPFTESILIGALGAFGMRFFFSFPIIPLFVAHMLLWCALDIVHAYTLDPTTLQDLPRFLLFWFIREVSALPLFMYGCAGNVIEWRGTVYTLHSDGTVSLVGVSHGKKEL